jgi:signal transduction histidine kinase
VKVQAELGEQPAIVFGNEDDLAEACWNLFHNALKFSKPNQTIWVTLATCGERVQVTVEDEGTGVAPENIKVMWKPFKSMPVGDVPKSAGLGLAIAREIVDQHGGTLEYNSRRAKGACFCIDLPLSKDNARIYTGGESA